jgi:hypothetical protein
MQKIIQLSLLVLLFACGDIKVDSGRNVEKAVAGDSSGDDGQNTPSDSDANIEIEQDSENESDGNHNMGPSQKIKLGGCFDSQMSLPSEMQIFCAEKQIKNYPNFKTELNIICEQKRFTNLFHKSCGWNGKKGREYAAMRVIEKTPVDDPGQNYRHVVISSLNIGPLAKSYAELSISAYEDPEEFLKEYEIPTGASISSDGKGVIRFSDSKRQVGYRFEVQGLSKTSFNGRVTVEDLSESLSLVFNEAVDQLEGIKHRSNLMIVVKQPGNFEKHISIETRVVPDAGQHQLARSMMRKLDSMEINNRYNNSLPKGMRR